MDWISGDSNNRAKTTTYGKKKPTLYGNKSAGGSVSFASLSSIGEDVDDVDFSRTTDVFSSSGGASNPKKASCNIKSKPTPLRDTSGNIPKVDRSSSMMVPDGIIVKEKNTRSSKRTTETPLNNSSSVKMSRSSPTSSDTDSIPTSVLKGSSVRSSSRRNTTKKGKEVDYISILEAGRLEDIEYLRNAMDAPLTSFDGLQLKAPTCGSKEQAILKAWLEKLGFEDHFLSFTMVYRLPVDKADVFRREFATFNAKFTKKEPKQSFGVEIDMEGIASSSNENSSMLMGVSSSSGKHITSVQVNNGATKVRGFSTDGSAMDGGMDLDDSEDISAENASEEKLWIQETLGSEDYAPGIKKMITRQFIRGANASKHPVQGAPRINILRCSVDSDDISSTCSTPGSSINRADQLSPVSQTPGGPEMNRVLSGVTSGMDNLVLQGTSRDIASLNSNASNSSLSTLVESTGETQKEHETAAINRVRAGEGFRQGSFDDDDDSSTESEGEDVNENEDDRQSEYFDEGSDMPMSATFPPRHSSSSNSSQKVWFGSVRQITAESSPGMAMAFDPSLNRSRMSCESPFVSASSRLSTGSNDGSDGNPGFMNGFNFARRNVDKHLSARRPPRSLANPKLRRSASDSERHHVMHSTEMSAAAGAVTPAGPTNRIRSIGKEFSTPNSVVGKIRSGEPGDYDWGITTASCRESIKRLTELLDSYDIPPTNKSNDTNPPSLRRYATMDDRLLRNSPSDYGRRNNFGQDMMAGESPTPNTTSVNGHGQNMVSIIPSADDDGLSAQYHSVENQSMQISVQRNDWLNEEVVAKARMMLSIVRDSPLMRPTEDFAPTEVVDIAEEDEDMDEDVVPDLNIATVSIRDRDKRRLQRSFAVKRRMSMCIKHKSVVQVGRRSNIQNSRLSVTNVLSPATPAKCRGSKLKGKEARRGSRLSFILHQDPLMEENEDRHREEFAPFGGNTNYDSSHECVLSEDSCLSERNFLGHVIGGVYQHSFDDFKPVVAPPATSDQRIIDVELKHSPDGASSLGIKLYVAKDKECKYIDLGPQWVWTRTAQDGYLVCSEPLRPSRKILCYYLSRHPLEWANDMEQNKHSPRSPHLADLSFMSGFCEPTPDQVPCNRYGEPLESFRHSLDDPMGGEHDFSPCKYDLLDNYERGYDRQKEADNQFRYSLQFLDTPAADWDNPNIASTILEYLFDPRFTDAGIGVYRLVCKSWAIGSYKLLANHLSEIGNCQQMNQKSWVSFMRAHNWGKFLSSGACKDVYMVQDNVGHIDAVSVMNIDDLIARDMELAIKQEIEVALLCSSLVSLNICPNLVLVHSIFQSSHGVSDALWKSNRPRPEADVNNALVVPRTSKKTKGLYQFIRMEFCKGGDLEEVVRDVKLLDVQLIKKMLFQMCFSLYACREQVGLRHYDIKLLNFFVTDGIALITTPANRHHKDFSQREFNDDTVVMHVAFGEFDFCIPMRACNKELIKLSDFGTSSVGTGDLGEPITMQQLTTLENSPPEFLILGSTARQAYSADTFCLGLSFFHLLTGDEPYEVLMENVKCPLYLATQLSKYWCKSNDTDENDPYHLICDLVKSLDLGEEESEAPGTVLFDTIYRYIVLFSGADDFLASCPWVDNPVWNLIVDALGLDVNGQGDVERRLAPRKCRGRPRRGGSPTARAECVSQYQFDFSRWSIHGGTHPKIVLVQERLNELGEGSWKLLEKLTHFDPARRCKMHEAIVSPIFYELRMERSQIENICTSTNFLHASFTTYKRSIDEGGTDALPFL